MNETLKKCPMCAEEIPAEATVCPYCSTQLVNEPPPPAAPPPVTPQAVPPAVRPAPPQVRAAAPAPKRKNARVWAAVAGVVALCICIAISATLWFERTNLPLLSSLFATATPTATPDPRILNPANHHKYLYVQIEKSWHQARDYCASRGGHLVTIQNTAENQYIYQLTSGNTWLGATDEVKEGTWVWVTGEFWIYTNWNSGEPNNYQIENYLTYHPEKLSSWNDVGNENHYFVCEWEP